MWERLQPWVSTIASATVVLAAVIGYLLEKQKIALEVRRLRGEAAAANSRVHIPTAAEIERYAIRKAVRLSAFLIAIVLPASLYIGTVSRKPNQPADITRNSPAAPVRPPVVKSFHFEDVPFAPGRATLGPNAIEILDDIVEEMTEPAICLTLEGHTSNVGSAKQNHALAARRVAVVRAYLIERGIAPRQLSTVIYGEERPKWDNADEDTRRRNDRVALVPRPCEYQP